MARKTAKQLEEERVRALAAEWQRSNSGTKLNSTQQETLKRMISVNNSSAQQELRRADYYSGGADKYDVSKVDYNVRNDFTNRTRTASKEVFSLRDGKSDATMEGRYSGGDDSFSRSRLENSRLQRAVNSVKNPMSTTSNTPSYDSNSTKKEKKPGFWSDVKDTFSTIGKVVNPFDDVKAGDAIKDFVQNGFKNTDTKEINRLANRTLDASTFNSASAVMKATKGDQAVDWQGNRKFGEGGGADLGADLLGYLTPGMGVTTALRGTKLAADMSKKGLAKIGQIAKEGAAVGGIIAAAETPAKEYVNPETTAAQHAARIGIETAAGVVLDPIIHGASNMIGKGVNKAAGKNTAASTLEARTNDTTTQQAMESIQPTQQIPPVQNPFEQITSKLKVPTMQNPIPTMPNVLENMMKQAEKITPLKNDYDAAVEQQYQYLKNSMGQGVNQGGVIRDNTGEVVNRYGRISNNPTWYQEFYKANGRRPNNTELRQLAEEQVRKGYTENGANIPSWAPDSVKQIDDQIDEITTMLKDTPENEAALRPYLEGLQQERAIAVEQALKQVDAVKAGKLPEGVKAMRTAPTIAPQSILPTLQTGNRTITHQKLLDSIRKHTGVTMRTGRLGVGDDAIQGIYKESPEVVRTKEYGDLETISHEIGHDFSQKYNLTDPRFDNELMQLGQTTSAPNYTPDDIRQEGIAEFMRRYLVNPQLAQQDAPQFFQHFQNVIPAKVLKGLSKVQDDVATWFNQPADMRMRGRINSTDAPKGIAKLKQALEKLPQTKEEFYTEAVDRLFPISKAEKEILGGKLADATESAYKRARLAAGTPRIADQKLQELEPVFKELRENGYEMQDLSDYLTAKHAADLEAQGIQSGFKTDEIAATLKKYDNPAMQDMQQKVVSYNNSLLDMLVDSGVLSKESVDAMRAKHPNYVPFFRHFDEEASAGVGSGKGFVDLTNPVKRMKGSSRNVINPLESMVKNTFSVVQAAEKNKVGLNLAKLAEKPGAGKWIERLGGKESVRNENIVTVFENGEKVQYQLSPELYKSVKALDKEITNKAVLMVGKATDWLRAGATLTPEFMLRNPIRDQFNATVVSDIGYNPIDFFRGLKEIGKVKSGKGSDVYNDWVKQGGAYGGYLSADRNILQENLSGLSEQGKSPLQRAIDTLKSPSQWGRKALETLQKGSEITEEATKVGAYKKGLKKGLTPAESAYQARELMDFNRMGNTMQSANRVVAFLNANVQGKDKLIRAFKENPVRTTGRILGTTLPPTAVVAMSETWASDEQKEMMNNLPQWEKDTYWHFAVPGTNEVARIPKPFDISVIPNTVERAVDAVKGDPYAFEGYGETLKNAVELPWLPTAALPIIENMANHSFFTGGDVVPQRDQSNSPRMQYGPTTSLAAREIGDKLNMSPYKVDNLYKGYTAGLGQYPLEGLNKVLSLISNKDVPTSVAKSFTESFPGIKAFFSNDMSGGKVMDDYYKVMEEQQAISADAKDRGEEPPNKAELKAFNKINKEMSETRTAYRQVMADTEMSPEEKRAEIDRLNDIMRDLARQGVQIFKPDYQ